MRKYDSNMVIKIIQYEEDNMSEEDTIEFFQELIDSGLAWELQGHYGRTAHRLIDAGLCHLAKENDHE